MDKPLNRNYRHIIINGVKYSCENIHELPLEPAPGLRAFLEEWWSPSHFIKLRTSGSTGKPKEIIVLKSAMVESARRTLNHFNLQPGMKALLCLPIEFIAGKMMVVRTIVGQLEMIAVPSSGQPLQNIDFEVDFAAFTPMQIYNEIKSASCKFHLLKKVIIGGGKVDATLDRLLQEQPFEAYETYGMTETLSHVAIRRINGAARQDSFFPMEDVIIGTDERGCLTLLLPGIIDKTLITNDLAEIRADGSFTIRGRADNVINSGGIKISPEAIEKKIESLLNIPFVISSIPDPRLGQMLVLVTEGAVANVHNLIPEFNKLLAKYEIPISIVTLEKFPRTASGKVKRDIIMEIISGDDPRKFHRVSFNNLT